MKPSAQVDGPASLHCQACCQDGACRLVAQGADDDSLQEGVGQEHEGGRLGDLQRGVWGVRYGWMAGQGLP